MASLTIIARTFLKNQNLILFLSLFLVQNSIAQNSNNREENSLVKNSVLLEFKAEINGQNLELTKNYFLSSIVDSLSINQLKLYISNIYLIGENELRSTSTGQYFLIDFNDSLSLKRTLRIDNTLDFKAICFGIGVDSSKQSQGVHGGDLDPTKGMYWSWQSGYINLKLEGKSNKCPARNNHFQFHIGGFQAPYNSIQNVILPIINKEKITLVLNLNKILDQESISRNYQIMSPNKKAMDFASKLPKLFSIQE